LNTPTSQRTHSVERVALRWRRHKPGDQHRTPEGTCPAEIWHEATGHADQYYVTDQRRYGQRGWRGHVGLKGAYTPTLQTSATGPSTHGPITSNSTLRAVKAGAAQELENGKKQQWVDTYLRG
jgi:hypothetical protein